MNDWRGADSNHNGSMHRFQPAHVEVQHNLGPICIGIGLAVVIFAQLLPMVPIAAAISLIGLGATITLTAQRQHSLILLLNFITYAVLVIWVVGMQLHARPHIAVFVDVLLASAITLATARLAMLMPKQ